MMIFGSKRKELSKADADKVSNFAAFLSATMNIGIIGRENLTSVFFYFKIVPRFMLVKYFSGQGRSSKSSI